MHGLRPDQVSYQGPAESLRDVWVALRAVMRLVLEDVTLADVLTGDLPRHVVEAAERYGTDERP